MIDGVLATCEQCGADVPLTAIRGVWAEGSTVHTPFVCECGFALCFHMSRSDAAAVKDSMRDEPQGLMTSAERTLWEFRSRLDAIEGLDDLEALWHWT